MQTFPVLRSVYPFCTSQTKTINRTKCRYRTAADSSSGGSRDRGRRRQRRRRRGLHHFLAREAPGQAASARQLKELAVQQLFGNLLGLRQGLLPRTRLRPRTHASDHCTCVRAQVRLHVTCSNTWAVTFYERVRACAPRQCLRRAQPVQLLACGCICGLGALTLRLSRR